MFRLFSCAALLALSGMLVTCTPRIVTVDVPFNAAEAAYINQKGTARIEGQAFLRQQGGGVVTGAGEEVMLIPVTDYSVARFAAIYGLGKMTYSGAIVEPTPVEYITHIRKTVADAQGNFIFDEVAPGDYFVATKVIWTIGDVRQGGGLYERITVPPGRDLVVRVLLTGK